MLVRVLRSQFRSKRWLHRRHELDEPYETFNLPKSFREQLSIRRTLHQKSELSLLGARSWAKDAITILDQDQTRSSDTHLLKLHHTPILETHGIHLYFKDESTHPTGSLKHRLARSLFIYGISNGWIDQSTTVIEASSGSTAVSEAYFADLLGLKFVAVVPRSTSKAKIDLILFYHGEVHFVEKASDVYDASRELAEKTKGHFMNQFEYAERATDWRGINNIAASIFSQMAKEPHPIPEWVVCAAGTGGTSATIGRYARYQGYNTRICCPDPENSVFFPYWQTGDKTLISAAASRIEGIGRPRVEPSFIRGVIDEMLPIRDTYSISAMMTLETLLGKKVGPSTGTNFYAMILLASKMLQEGKKGSIVGLLCDSGDRYANTYYNTEWLKANGFEDPTLSKQEIIQFLQEGCKLNDQDLTIEFDI